jgi:DNA repair protein RecN (Recombination protein N)
MLCDLRIRDLLLIDELEINLEPGFNVMTGETGAGKSVVIGALGLVLGGRARPDLVRPGRPDAEVEALFDLSDSPALQQQLEEAGLGDGSELVVRRVVQANGRSRAYLNGRLSAATELANLAPLLVDIASQHESVSLTDPSTHLSYLDAFGGLDENRSSLSCLVDSAKDLAKRIADLEQLARGRAERDAFIRFQLSSIDEVSPKAGEMEELKAERSRLRSASRLSDSARRAAYRLSEADSCICDDLRSIIVDLRSACDLDSSLQDALTAVENAQEALSDAGRDLARYAERIHDDPNRLEQIEERLFRLEKLLRQHGPSEQTVLEARERLAKELDELEQVDNNISDLRESFNQSLANAASAAKSLSSKRKKIAEALGAAISAELAGLGMGGAKVVVDVAPLDGATGDLAVDGARLSRDGIDRVEFLIAPNKGIAPRPLRKIASGGELSRALLALKRVLASKGPAGLYVFDEVDTGVGGAVAERIGRALADVSSHRQVLCITHLAPIAALANAHFVVEKRQNADLATSNVRRFKGKDRIREVARMLAGAKVTDAAVTAAAEMVREGRGASDAQAV